MKNYVHFILARRRPRQFPYYNITEFELNSFTEVLYCISLQTNMHVIVKEHKKGVRSS